MLLRRIYDDKLAQASYLIGCAATGEALVVDPNRDTDQYLEAAAAEDLRITHVTETHIHADFLSGSRELARRAGAELYLSDEGGAEWKYDFADEPGVTLVKGGDHFMVGNIRMGVIHTPGHTPEHVSFLVTDTAGANEPMGILTGDFVFVGDVGRPDLLERAAHLEGTMVEGARTLFRSLREFRKLPGYLQIWPGHGAGSACGKALGAVPTSTVGYERLFNWGLAEQDEDAFVDAVLAGQPEPPKYFAQMKRMNREGPGILSEVKPPRLLDDQRLPGVLGEGGLVIDTRPADAYAEGHVPGTLNIPLNRSFNTWAGWLVPYDRDFHLILGDDGEGMEEVWRDLAMIGLDRIGGFFRAAAIDAFAAAGGELGTVAHMTPSEVAERLKTGSATVIDVRGHSEWEAGRLPGVPNIPLGYLPDRLDEIPRDRPVVVHCLTGARSAIAVSLLQASGIHPVFSMGEGFSGWVASGRRVEREEEVAA
jgi:hydroxyacylglutathione hydrolase